MERTLSSDLFFDHSQATGSSALPLRIFTTALQWQRRIISRRQLARLDARPSVA